MQISTLFTFLFRVRNLGAIFEHTLLASKSSTKILRTDFFSRLPAQLSLQSPDGDHRARHFEHFRCSHRNLLFPVHQVSDNRARVLDRQETLYAIQTRNHKTFFRHVNSHLYVYFKVSATAWLGVTEHFVNALLQVSTTHFSEKDLKHVVHKLA